MSIDMTAFLGPWPFRALPHRDADGLGSLIARVGISHAVVTPLPGFFYKNPAEAVAEMLKEMGESRERLLPCAIINPTFPGWRRDLATMVDDWGCVACALSPTYHSYRIYDQEASDLLGALAEMGIPALLFVRLQDERSHPPLMQVPPLPIDHVVLALRAHPHLAMAVCNLNLPAEAPALVASLARPAPTLLTTSYKSLQLARMVDLLGAEHLAYASCMPLFYPESSMAQVRDAGIEEAARYEIMEGNARAFLSIPGGGAC